jgi:hypothetical protein
MRDPVDIYMNTLVPMVVEQTNRGERGELWPNLGDGRLQAAAA